MKIQLTRAIIAIFAILLNISPSYADEGKLKVVTSFSILGDMIKNVAGDDIELRILVGANGDTHEYQPTTEDSKAISNADLIIINGLGFEPRIEKMIKSSGYKGKVIIASNHVKTIAPKDGEDHDHGHHDDAEAHDPHAWQNAANGKIYTSNISEALIEADPKNADIYRKNSTAYLTKLDDLDNWVRFELLKVPSEKRKLISTHDAFAYFAKAYNVEFLSPLGLSTESQPSAKDIARLIDQIRKQKITALFFENMSDQRIIKQLEKDAGAKIGGTLYSDALSLPEEPASTYIDMFKHNVSILVSAMQQNPGK